MDKLSNLIIRKIIADVGAVPEALGKGITDPELALGKRIKIKYESFVKEHIVYGGKIDFENKTELSGLLVDLTVEIPEYLFLFNLSNLPIHAVKVLYDENDKIETYLKIQNKDKWLQSSLMIQCRILADFERIVSLGFLWNSLEDAKVENLYQEAVNLLNN